MNNCLGNTCGDTNNSWLWIIIIIIVLCCCCGNGFGGFGNNCC